MTSNERTLQLGNTPHHPTTTPYISTNTSTPRPTTRADFDIAIICALPIESDAIEAIFDTYHEDSTAPSYNKAAGDTNTYTTGTIGTHNVVLVFMPSIGKTRAASVAASFRSSFPNIRLGLVVGVCGGVPNPPTNDPIYLGDVVVSTSIVQYDFGRQYADRVRRRDTLRDNLREPVPELSGFLVKLQSVRGRKRLRELMASTVEDVLGQEDFRQWKRPPATSDVLFHAGFRHKHHTGTCAICMQCDAPDDPVCENVLELDCTAAGCHSHGNQQYARDNDEPRSPIPQIHFGRIASGDLVIKSSLHRDRIVAEENVIAFEMEGAGVWDNFPTIVVKAACDYADSHKHKGWQRYAAIVAAACTKALLREWRGVDRPVPPAGRVAGGEHKTVFNNYGAVGSQVANQTVQGSQHFAPVYQYTGGRGVNYGSQVGFNFGTVNNLDQSYKRS